MIHTSFGGTFVFLKTDLELLEHAQTAQYGL
jgi:hypothetical protein